MATRIALAAEPAARPRSVLWHGLRDGSIVAGLLFTAYLFLVVAPAAGTVGFDAFAYWAVDLSNPYRETAGALGAFTYSPVFARAFSIAALLPWWQFLTLWLACLLATVIWLGRESIRTILALLAFPPIALELYHGNIHLLMAAAIVLGYRYPAFWAFPILTKVSPGIGLIWFLVRGEWRSLAIAIATTGVLAGLSLLVDGGLWVAWITDSLGRTAAGAPLNQLAVPVPLLVRLPIAAGIVAWGARTGRPWTMPVAVTLSLPVLWPTGFAVLAALPWVRSLEASGFFAKATPGQHMTSSTSGPEVSLPEPDSNIA